MLKVNSKKVEQGDTFIAIKSKIRDGHDFIEDAIEHGAACIIAEHGEYSVKTIIVRDTRKYLADYLKDLYADKLNKMKIIGITGTNGKTTSCYFIYQLLNKMGIKTAYIGTIGFYLNETRTPLVNTTPDLYDLYEMLVEASNNDCQVVAMEVSSQALDMRRLEGIMFDMAIFTNLTEDHLDYHQSMEEYEKAKMTLFQQLKGPAIINMDSPQGKDFVLAKNKNILYGQGDYDYKISDISTSTAQTTFKITHDNEIRNITLPMPGTYNAYNYMNAYIVCDLLKLDLSSIVDWTLSLKAPDGRYQMIKNDKYSVIVDYAHTPDAVANVLKSVTDFAEGKIITLIGCGGDRDRTKRPMIGKIATYYSDYVYFTSDNPRTEDPEAILKDITTNIEKSNFEIIVDRAEAIKKAITNLEEKDILLILGKGHEDYQIIGKEKFPFSDVEEVKKYVK